MSEEWEELYLDPWIEHVMLQWGAQTGAPKEVAEFWSMFVCSFREAALGAASSILSSSRGKSGKKSFLAKIKSMLSLNTQNKFATYTEQLQNSQTNTQTAIDKVANEKKKHGFLSLIDTQRIASFAFSIPSLFVGGGGMAFASLALDIGSDILFDIELGRVQNNKQFLDPLLEKLNTQKHEIDENIDLGQKIATELSVRTKPITKRFLPPSIQSLVDQQISQTQAQSRSITNQLAVYAMQAGPTNNKQNFKDLQENQNEIQGIEKLDIKSGVDINNEFTVPVSGPNYANIPTWGFDPILRFGKSVKMLSFVDTMQRPLNVWIVNRKAQRTFNMDLTRPVVGIIKGRVIVEGRTIVNEIGDSLYIDVDTSYTEVQKFLGYDFDTSTNQWSYDPDQQVEFVYADEALDTIDIDKSYDVDYRESTKSWVFEVKNDNILARNTIKLFDNHEGFKLLWTEVGYSMAGKGTLQGMVTSDEIASDVDRYYEGILSPLKKSFKLLFKDLAGDGRALRIALRGLFLRSWLSTEKVQEIEDNGKSLEEYREAGLKLFDKQFPRKIFDNAGSWNKLIDQRISFVINDYIMREHLHLDQEGITPEIFHGRLQEFLYNMDIAYGSNFLDLKAEILNEKTRTSFLIAFSELFFPPNPDNQLYTRALGQLKTATGFFGWIKESSYWYGVFPSRLNNKVISNGFDFEMYGFMELSPQNPIRPSANDYNNDILDGKQSEVRLEWNTNIMTSQLGGFPKNGREMDMVTLLWDALSYSTHVKTQREINNKKFSERISSVTSDYWSSVIADAEIFSVRGTTQEITTGVFRDHEADIATTLNYIGDFNERKEISERMAKKVLSVKLFSEFKSPLDLKVFHKVTELINNKLNGLSNFDENDIRNAFLDVDFENEFWAEITKIYGVDKFLSIFQADMDFLQNYYDTIRNLFSNTQNFNTLYQKLPGSSKHQLIWQGDIGNYLLAKDNEGNKIPLTPELLPENIQTLDGNNNWVSLPSDYSFNEVHVLIVGDNWEVGVIKLSTLVGFNGKLPQGVYLGFNGIRSAVICNPNGNLLNGVISLDTENRQFILDELWYKDQVSENIGLDANFNKDDPNGIFTLKDAYRSLILSTGDKASIMFQKQVVNFVPLEPFIPLFPNTKIQPSSISVIKKIMKDTATLNTKNLDINKDAWKSFAKFRYQLENALYLPSGVPDKSVSLDTGEIMQLYSDKFSDKLIIKTMNELLDGVSDSNKLNFIQEISKLDDAESFYKAWRTILTLSNDPRFKAYNNRIPLFSPTFDTKSDFEIIQIINEMLITELSYPAFVLIQNGISLFTLDEHKNIELNQESVTRLGYTSRVQSFRISPLFKRTSQKGHEMGNSYFINLQEKRQFGTPIRIQRGEKLVEMVSSMLTIGYRQGFKVKGESQTRYYTISPPGIDKTFNSFIRQGAEYGYYRNAFDKITAHIYSTTIQSKISMDLIKEKFSDTSMWTHFEFDEIASETTKRWKQLSPELYNMNIVDALNQEYDLSLYRGGTYVVNFDSPAVLKTLKIIESILINSVSNSKTLLALINEILRLSDSPFDSLAKSQVSAIIRAGISKDMKFKIVGEMVSSI